jgi:hypothetical protein
VTYKKSAAKQIALGNARMIIYSIYEYLHKHDGELPERIELHPKVMNGFLNELMRDYPRYFEDYTEEGYFLGIPFVTSESFDRPRLINHEGKIEYL